jgi:hypothetical protein
MVVQNKDDLEIPLMLETMPTPKEFKDAIESLSPEQKRFCKAFRSMQLASSLFGVCVIQVKPQLERLLNLPRDSLTKEIQLTNDLMELFTKYQIPSDLISYAGDGDDGEAPHVTQQVKLDTVKAHVAALMDTIAKAREKELEEEKQEASAAKMKDGFGYEDGFGCENSDEDSDDDDEEEDDCDYEENEVEAEMCKGDMQGFGMALSSSSSSSRARNAVLGKKSATSTPAKPTPADGDRVASSSGSGGGSGGCSRSSTMHVDYTKIPSLLDKKCSALDEDNALRCVDRQPYT